MDQGKFVEDCLYKIWSGHFKFFRGCLPQILIGPLFNTLTQMVVSLTFYKLALYKIPFKIILFIQVSILELSDFSDFTNPQVFHICNIKSRLSM